MLTTTTINSQQYTFRPKYNMPPIGNIVSYFYVELYDSNKLLLQKSNYIYSNKIEYTIDGLINGNSYYIAFYVFDVYGYEYDTGLISYHVLYDTTNIIIDVDVIDSCIDSSIVVSLGEIIQIDGDIDGAYSYVNPYITKTNNGLFLAAESTLKYSNLPLTKSSYPIFTLMLPYSGYEGIIMKMTDSVSGRNFLIQYNNKTLDLIFDGTVVDSIPFMFDGLTTYIVGIIGWKLYINPYYKHAFNPVPALPVNVNPVNANTTGMDLMLSMAVDGLTENNFEFNLIES